VRDTYKIELTLEQREAVLRHFGLAADAVCVTAIGEPTAFFRAERRWRETWGRAETLWREGNTDEALVLAREAVQTFPTAHGHCWLASLLLAVGQSREALVEYQAAIRLSPSSSDAYLELGRALARAEVVEELIAAYREILGENWQVPLLSRTPDPVSLFLDQQPNARARSACRRNLEEGLWGVELSKILEILSVPSDLDELWMVTGTAEAWEPSVRRQCSVVEAFFEFCEDQGYVLQEEEER
jgi:tetratricopeptide (TPR) repeat protein